MNNNQLFADHLRTFRKSQGWSQEEMAYLLGIPRETLSKYETAARGITLKTLLKWAVILNIDPSELIPRLPKK